MSNIAVAAGVLGILLAGLMIQGAAVYRRFITGGLSRKAAHVGLGFIIIASWTLYDTGTTARWYAALPPFVLVAYFAALGTGIWKDERTVFAASRSGSNREMLAGPLLYCAAFTVLTLASWRTPLAVAAASVLVFGDGLAEVAGRRLRSPRLPWARTKTFAGTVGALLGGWAGALAMFAMFHATGHFEREALSYVGALLAVAVTGALAESASPGALDNVTVTGVCALAGLLLL